MSAVAWTSPCAFPCCEFSSVARSLTRALYQASGQRNPILALSLCEMKCELGDSRDLAGGW
jgi:hypothetical protein